MERTLALIKPDATSRPWTEELLEKAPTPDEAPDDYVPTFNPAPSLRAPDKSVEILARIAKEGFRIVAQKILHLSKAEAESFYAEHAGRPFFDALTTHMSSGPTVALVLEKEGAIGAWRALMGATNSLVARAAAEAAHPLDESLWPLRAAFGTDGTRNATHGSDSSFSALRETAFFFPELEPDVWERALALVLPHAVARVDAVVTTLEDAGFHVVARQTVKFVPGADSGGSWGGPNGMYEILGPGIQLFPAIDERSVMGQHMASGDSVALLVERRGARKHLRLLLGPAPSVAKVNALHTLHALFGEDDDLVGVITPDGGNDLIAGIFPNPLPLEATLAVVKPGTSDAHYRAIVADIIGAGFTILAETRRTLAKEEAENFYAEHRGRPFFDGLCSYMSSGSVVALALAKPGAIRSWRLLQGPTNTAVAVRDAPSSIRARFGVDGTRNATHGSDSPASASLELRFYFPDLPLPTRGASIGGDAAIDYIKSTVVASVFNASKGHDVTKTLEAVLVDGLAELSKTRPSSDPVEAIRWLGEWLIENNPRRGVIAESVGGAKGPTVVEPDDDAAATVPRSRALARGARKTAPAATPAPAPSPAARTIVFVLGAPGAGKGTQCELIAKQFGYTHLSTGDLLREEVAKGSDLGRELEGIMAAGNLVSTALVLKLVASAMASSGSTKFLLDGYPRALDQAVQFEAAFGEPAFVLSFDADEATLEARLVERGKSSGRADDNVDSIRKRFATFKAQSEAVIDFYGRVGKLRRVNSLRSKEAVFAETATHFRAQYVWLLGGPGSGRSTMAARAVKENLGWTHLSSGDVLRAEIEKGTELGHEIAAIMRRGDSVPSDVTVKLLREAVENAGPTGRYILDGVPSDLEQAVVVDRDLGAPLFVINLVAPDATLLARAGSRGDGRVDAHSAVHKRQLEVYKKETQPVVDLYRQQALVRTVDASGSVDTTWAAFRRALQPTVVFVLGGPGSGKGTQCARVSAEFGFAHLSAGDLLRAEVDRGSAEGAAINAHQAAGTLVPVETTLRLISRAMSASRARRVLIDGYPRSVEQAHAFAAALGDPDFVLYFDCPEDTMRARLLRRGQTSGRVDDNEDAIVKRFRTFVTTSMPVIGLYGARGQVRSIDATPSADIVYASVRPCFMPSVVLALGAPGSGKATQCARLSAEFGFHVLTTGDLLRAEVKRETAQGAAVAGLMKAGALVPDSLILDLLAQAMAAADSRRFIVHGFPRTAVQAAAFSSKFGPPAMVLNFTVPREIAAARMALRGKTSMREDDTDEKVVAARLDAYEAATLPVVRAYDAARLVRAVPSSASADAVYARARQNFTPSIVCLLGEAGDASAELCARAGTELGYATLDADALYAAEITTGSAAGVALAAAQSARRTPPLSASVAVLKKAMTAAPAVPRFIICGFPRLYSQGFPAVHDQVVAAEEQLGAFKGAVVVSCSLDARAARLGAKTTGELAVVRLKMDSFRRERAPVASFFEKLQKACAVDTSGGADDAFEAARPFLE